MQKEVGKPCTWSGKRQEVEDNMEFNTDNQILRPVDAVIIPTLHNSDEITKPCSFSPHNVKYCCLCFLISRKYNNKATTLTYDHSQGLR